MVEPKRPRRMGVITRSGVWDRGLGSRHHGGCVRRRRQALGARRRLATRAHRPRARGCDLGRTTEQGSQRTEHPPEPARRGCHRDDADTRLGSLERRRGGRGLLPLRRSRQFLLRRSRQGQGRHESRAPELHDLGAFLRPDGLARCVAFDAAGNRSKQANATGSSAACVDSVPPSAPSGFTQVSTSENAVVLAWTPSSDNSGVVSYGVYQYLALVQSPAAPQVALGGLACATTYQYAFDAVDAAGNHSQLATAYVRTSDCPAPTPAPRPCPCTCTCPHAPRRLLRPRPRTGASAPPRTSAAPSRARRTSATARTATFTSPRTFTDGVECTNAVFGDPLVGTLKRCEIRDSASTSPPPASDPAPVPAPASSADTHPPSAPSGLSASNVTQAGLTLSLELLPGRRGRGRLRRLPRRHDGRLAHRAECERVRTHLRELVCLLRASARRRRQRLQPRTAERRDGRLLGACARSCSERHAGTHSPRVPRCLERHSTSVSLRWNASRTTSAWSATEATATTASSAPPRRRPPPSRASSCGTAHTFAVDAFDAAGNTSPRSAVTGIDAGLPRHAGTHGARQCERLLAHRHEHRAHLVGIERQRRRQRLRPLPPARAWGTSTSTTGIFSGLTCNTNYTLAVDAVDAAGNRSSKTAVMVSTTACPDTQAPSAPSGLAAANVTQTGLTLTWNASSDNVAVTGYDVYRNGTKATVRRPLRSRVRRARLRHLLRLRRHRPGCSGQCLVAGPA